MHGSSLEIPTAGDINLTITVLEASSIHRLDHVVAERKLLVVATIHLPRNHIAARKTALYGKAWFDVTVHPDF